MSGHPAKKAKPRYVLVIEDNSHHAELLTELLDHHFAPIIIHTVDTIEDGIDFATQSYYDLIITAGIVQGVPTTDAIPKLTRIAAGTPIIVISGYGDERLAAEFIKSGATEYLAKTKQTLENLPSLLERHFAKRRGKQHRSHTKTDEAKTELSTPASLLREVDRLTQQALAIMSPRRKRRLTSPDPEQLDRLLTQIRRLREMTSKLVTKE